MLLVTDQDVGAPQSAANLLGECLDQLPVVGGAWWNVKFRIGVDADKEEEAGWHTPAKLKAEIGRVKEEMLKAAADPSLEKAAELRDKMLELEMRGR